jgi:hypothetical protein
VKCSITWTMCRLTDEVCEIIYLYCILAYFINEISMMVIENLEFVSKKYFAVLLHEISATDLLDRR